MSTLSRPRRIPVILILLVAGALLSVFDFLTIRHLIPLGSNEGAAAGWWWCLSLSWLVAGLEAPGEASILADIIGARAPSRARRTPHMRWYLVAVFSLLGVLETAQHGAPAVLGFLAGATGFAAPFALAEMIVALINRLRRPALVPAHVTA